MKWIFSTISIILISLAIIIVILFDTSPSSGVAVKFSLFLFSTTFLVSLFILIAGFRIMVKGDFKNLKVIIRRSIILALVVVGLLTFSFLKVLTILSALTYLISLLLIEMFFMTRKIERYE